MSREKQNAEIYRPMNEELFNNIEKKYQELAKVKAESEQIEEMEMTPLDILANDINQHCPDLAENYCGDTHCVACLANALYNAGYRKQSEGEWIRKLRYSRNYDDFFSYTCSECNTHWDAPTNYCPNCGAKMKGGAE